MVQFVHTSVHELHYEAAFSPRHHQIAQDEQHVLRTTHRIKGDVE
jgi:hypothetical protein